MDLIGGPINRRPTAEDMLASMLRRWRPERWPKAESVTVESRSLLDDTLRVHLATGAGMDIKHTFVDIRADFLKDADDCKRLAELIDDAYRLTWPPPAEWTRRRFRIGRHDGRRLAT